MKGNFTDFHPKIIEWAGLAPENAGLLGDEYDLYMGGYDHHFTHAAQSVHFRRYGSGLMSEAPRKSMEPIAFKTSNDEEHIHPRSVQQFMRRSPWPTERVKKTYQEKVASHVRGKGLVLTLDATNFPKEGHHSPGVGRQYGGRDGKVDPNQVAVMCGLVSDEEYALLDYKLYLQEHWFDEPHRQLRDECGIPKEQKFETKNTIASKMIVAMRDNLEVKPECVLVDAGFGHDKVFLDSLRVPYFADIHSTDKFFASAPSFAVPPWGGRGRVPVVPRPDIQPLPASLIVENSPASWEKVSFGLGSKGYVVGEEKIVRVMEIRDKLPRNWIWLYARKFENGTIRCSISDLPEDTPVETFRDLARKRWTIEQSFEECKTDLGLTHFEGRSYVGWQRHVLIVMVVHLFLQLMRKKFTVDFDMLSKDGQYIYKNDNQDCDKSIPIFTLGCIKDLISAVLLRNPITEAFRKVKFTMKNTASSFKSYLKRQYQKLHGVVLDFCSGP